MNFCPVFPNLAERAKSVAAHPNAAAIRRAVSGFKPAFPPRVTVDGRSRVAVHWAPPMPARCARCPTTASGSRAWPAPRRGRSRRR